MMSNKDFEQDLAQLYQQRKANLDAPNIDLDSNPTAVRKPAIKSAFLVIGGGLFSAATFAVMTYLIKQPAEPLPIAPTSTPAVVEIKINKARQDSAGVQAQEPLPEPPIVKARPTSTLSKPTEDHHVLAEDVSVINVPNLNISIPKLQHQQYRIEPVYKVLPDIKKLDVENSMVKLRYDIDESGRVINIDKLDSTADRQVLRVTKRALSQWRYPAPSLPQQGLVIVFEFSQNQS
ncbi:hypothetical protein [Thalassotalea eurytherma]|nr:hypothetical protein [Thalassotalea eurytherma]